MRSFICILLLLGCLAACNEQPKSNQQPQALNFNHTVFLNGKPIKVVVFDTPAKREKGLMWVKDLPKDHGALFVFEQEGEVGFWMKNTLIPLDILFFNSEGLLVKGLAASQPCQVQKCELIQAKETKFVLELPVHYLSVSNLRLSDLI